MILLDTNVVSELMRPSPNSKVVDWVARQGAQNLYTSAVNEAELRYGVEILPAGRRRDRLSQRVEILLRRVFAGRILPFDSAAAQSYAVIAAARRAAGRPINHADCQIAAIARSRGAWVATRDVGGFDGSEAHVINPWAHG
jgi:predicted nucleic acid-binding protein